MLSQNQLRIAKAYAVLQMVIWAKAIAFFALYGRGKVMLFSFMQFPPEARIFDFYFHEGMHVLIGLLAIAYGKNVQKLEWKSFALTILSAVALHNFMYYLTSTHPNLIYSARDFLVDSIILSIAILVGHFIGRTWLGKIRVPLLEFGKS